MLSLGKKFFAVNEGHIDDIKHTTGLSRQKKPYRNHFNCNDNKSWNELVGMGLANKKKVSQCAGQYMYFITDDGFKMIQEHPTTFNLDKRYIKMSVGKLREKFDV